MPNSSKTAEVDGDRMSWIEPALGFLLFAQVMQMILMLTILHYVVKQ